MRTGVCGRKTTTPKFKFPHKPPTNIGPNCIVNSSLMNLVICIASEHLISLFVSPVVLR